MARSRCACTQATPERRVDGARWPLVAAVLAGLAAAALFAQCQSGNIQKSSTEVAQDPASGVAPEAGLDARVRAIVDRAARAEPALTEMLLGIAQDVGGRLEGLEQGAIHPRDRLMLRDK